MTKQETTTSLTPSLLTQGFSFGFPSRSTPLSECKVPGAWPSEEITLKVPGAWIDTEDENWCQHVYCWVETAFGFEHYCSRHKDDGEVVEILLGGLEL
jgi:hypothetical protein